MSPTTRARPHFATFQRIVPADVTLVFGELGLVPTALTDLKDRTDAILAATPWLAPGRAAGMALKR